MAGNRKFHNKFHSANHHTLPSPHIKDSGLDPIASHEFPFIGDFVLNGVVSASNNYLLNNRALASTLDTVPHGQPVPYGWNVLRDSTYIDGDVTITGNLSALGELTYLHTQVSVTSASEIEIRADNSNGRNAALVVDQYGKNDIVHFKNDGVSTLLITGSAGGSEGLGGWIGVNLGNLQDVDRPNQRMTVVGSVSVVPDPFEVADQNVQKDAGTSGSLYIEGGLHVNDHAYLDQVTIDTTDGKFLVSGGNNDITANVFDVDVPTFVDAITADTTDGDFYIHGTHKVLIDTENDDGVGLDVDTHAKFDQVTIDTTDGPFEIQGSGSLAIATGQGLIVDTLTQLDETRVDTADGKFLVESTQDVLPGAENPLDVDVPTLLDKLTVNTDDGKLYVHGNPNVAHNLLNPVDIDVPTLLDMLTIDTTDGDTLIHGPGRIKITTHDTVDDVGLQVVSPAEFQVVTIDLSSGNFSVIDTDDTDNVFDVDVPVELSKTTINTTPGKTTITGDQPNIADRNILDVSVPVSITGGITVDTSNSNQDVIFTGSQQRTVFKQTQGTTFETPTTMNRVTVDTTDGIFLINGDEQMDVNVDLDISDSTLYASNVSIDLLQQDHKLDITGAGSVDIDVPVNLTNAVNITAPTNIDVTDGPLRVYDTQPTWANKQRFEVSVPTTTQALTASVANGDVEIVGISNRLIVEPIADFENTVNVLQRGVFSGFLDVPGIANLNKTNIDTTDGDLTINGSGEMEVDVESTFNKNVHFKGDITVDGNAYLSGGEGGKIYVGSEVDDSIVFDADVDSDIQPNITDKYRLGDDTLNRWLSVDSKYGEFEQLGAITTNTSGSNIEGHLDVDMSDSDQITFRGTGHVRILTPMTTYNQLSATRGPWIFGGVEEEIVDPIESIGPDGLTYIDPPETLPAFRVECRSLFQNSLTALGPVQIGDLPDGVNESLPDPTFEVLGTAVIRDGNLKIQSDIRHLHDNSTLIRFDENMLDFKILDESILTLTERFGDRTIFAGNAETPVDLEVYGNMGINGRNEISDTLGDGIDLHGSMRVTDTLSARTLVVDYLTVLEQSSGNVGGGGSGGGSSGIFGTLSGDSPRNSTTTYNAGGMVHTYNGTDVGIEFDASKTGVGDFQKLYSVSFEAKSTNSALGVVAGDTQTSTYQFTCKWDPIATQAYVNSTEYAITHTSVARFATVTAVVAVSPVAPYTERIVKLVVQSDVDCDFYIHNVVVQDKPERIDAVAISDLSVLGKLIVESDQRYDNKITFNDHVTFTSFVSSDIMPGDGANLGSVDYQWNQLHVQDIISDTISTTTATTEGDMHVKGMLTVDGSVFLKGDTNGEIHLGINTQNKIYVDGTVDSNIIPSTPDVHALGDQLYPWSEIHVSHVISDTVTWTGGDSTLANESYAALTSTSADWNTAYDLTNKEPVWDQNVNTVSSNSARWESNYTDTSTSSADWNKAFEIATQGQDNWNSVFNTTQTNSASWQHATHQLATSAVNWNDTFLQFSVSSELWNAGAGQTALSAVNWNDTYHNVNPNYENWIATYLTVESNSGNWHDTYTTYIADSATNNTHYNQTTFVNASGDTITGDLHIKGNLRVDGNAYLSAGASGSINVGDSDTDNVVFHADIASDLVPDADNMFDISSSDKRWRHMHLSGDANVAGHVTVDGLVTWNGGDSDQSNQSYNFINTTSGTDGFANLENKDGNLVLKRDQVPPSAITKVHNVFNESDVFNLSDPLHERYVDVFEGHLVLVLGSNTTLLALEDNPTGTYILEEDRWEGYQKLITPQTMITSVNGQTGPSVALDADSIGDAYTDHKFLTEAEKQLVMGASSRVRDVSGDWNYAVDTIEQKSSDWTDTHTAVLNNSGSWDYATEQVSTKGDNWDEAHQIAVGYVNNTQEIYQYIQQGQGLWTDTYALVAASSARWNAPPQGTAVTLTRTSKNITTPAGEREYLALQSGNPNKDSVFSNVDHEHAMVLPQNTIVKRVMVRGASTGTAEIEIGVHTNHDVSDYSSEHYATFDTTPIMTVSGTSVGDYQPMTFDFTEVNILNAGETLGISVSASEPIGSLNLTIMLEHVDYSYSTATRDVYDPSTVINELQDQIQGLQEQVGILIGQIPDPTFRITIIDTEENIIQTDNVVSGTVAFATDTTKILVYNTEFGDPRWIEFDNN